MPHDFVRLATRVGEHFCHSFLRWQNDRQLVRPIVFQEKTMQVLFAVAVDQSRRRALELDLREAISIGGAGQSLNDLLHNRPAAQRVLSINVGS